MKKKIKKKRDSASKVEVRQFSYFVNLLAVMPADEFIGIARVLKVRLVDKSEKGEDIRSFVEIYEDLIEEFLRLTPTQRHNLIWIMEAALSEDDENELHADKNYKHLPTSLLIPRAPVDYNDAAECQTAAHMEEEIDATTSTSTD